MQNTLIRDTQIADDIFQKIQLGWLEQEFSVYGTAYCEDNTMQYKVSNYSKKIYTFLDAAGLQNLYPSNIIHYTERCSVPAGMKEEKTLQTKVTLAKKLRDEYPKELFILLNQTAETIRDNSAYSFLEKERENLEGEFDRIRLGCFEELVNYSYKALRLTTYQYEDFMRWVQREHKNFEDDFVPKQTSSGIIYGMMYQKNGQEYYIEDALVEYIYEEKFRQEQNGLITTPIYKHLFWYDYQTSFKEARTLYTKKIQHTIQQHYLPQVQKIRTANRFNKQYNIPLQQLLEITKNEMGQLAFETAKRYLHLWGIAEKII